jgi:NAD-reducing hydrogenase small subunit
MAAKVKVATVWLGGCSGCHMSFLDLDERLVDLAGLIELVASPVVDVKEIPPVDVGIVEGAVCNKDNEEVLVHLRKQCKVLVALGDCAAYAGVPAMRNQFKKEDVLDRAYVDAESTLIGEIPHSAEVPELLKKVRAIKDVVKVDAYIPGCPPNADDIYYALTELLAGRIPEWPEGKLHFD